MPNGDYPYSYERCFENRKKIEILELKMDNMHTEVMSKFENDRRERVVQQRWVIGILLTVLLGVGSLVIAVWGKI